MSPPFVPPSSVANAQNSLSQERDRWFESGSLRRRVRKPSVPQRRSEISAFPVIERAAAGPKHANAAEADRACRIGDASAGFAGIGILDNLRPALDWTHNRTCGFPCVRLSDKTSRLRPRHIAPKPGQTHEPEGPRSWPQIGAAATWLLLRASRTCRRTRETIVPRIRLDTLPETARKCQ